MARRSYWLLGCLFYGAVTLAAVDVPLVLKWDSQNTVSYWPSQSGKELAWNEFYRIGIGIDSLRVRNVCASFLLQNQADFLSNQVQLHSFELSWQNNAWLVEAATKTIGYGKDSYFNEHQLVTPLMDEFRYQATRFNGVTLGNHIPPGQLSLALGGNVQNQAMAALAIQKDTPLTGLSYALSLEARARDSHWTTPVAIGALECTYNTGIFKAKTISAYSRFFARKNTVNHGSLYLYGELSAKPSENLQLNALGETLQLEPDSSYQSRFQASVHKSLGGFCFNQGAILTLYNHIAYGKAYLGADYLLSKDSRLGLVYSYEGSKLSTGKHNLGLQAQLSYGF